MNPSYNNLSETSNFSQNGAAISSQRPGSNLRKSSKTNICPCCNKDHGCKIGDDEVWCLRITSESEAPDGWLWVRLLGGGGYGSKLVRQTGDRQKTPRNYHWQDRIGDRTIEKLSPLRVLNRGERDFHYRKIWQALELSEEHQETLRSRRGLTDSEIEWANFRTWVPNKHIEASGNLPGVNLRGNRLVGPRGFAIPFLDPKGRITGFQIATDNPDKKGKYLWGSSVQRGPDGLNIGGNGPQLVNGELPIACWMPNKFQLGVVNLCEGGLKSAIAASKLGEIFLGCASSAHYGPATLKQYLKEIARLPGFERPVIRLWPDAGAVENTGGIPLGNLKAIRMCRHWGYKVEVAWWGQRSKKHDLDVDDLLVAGRLDEVTFITPEEFWALHSPENRERIFRKEERAGLRVGDIPASNPFGRQVTREKIQYLVSDRLDAWTSTTQKHRYVLDTSGTGTGKSFTTGGLRPEDFDALQLVYVSADHRNVTTETLQEWPDLQGRHGGLMWIDGPEGTKQLRRATKYDAPDIKPNCDRHQLAQILPSRNTPSTGEYICQGCRHRKTCRDGSGEFTFIFDRQQVLKESRYRAHPSSLDPKTFVGSPEDPATVLIVDEADRLEFTHSFVAASKDVERAIARISEYAELEAVRHYLERLLSLMAEKLPLHGYCHEEILEALPPIPELNMHLLESISEQNLEFLESGWVPPEIGGGNVKDYPREVQAFVRQTVDELTSRADETVELRWLPEFFRSLQGEGRLRLSSEGLRMTMRNQHLINTLTHPHVKAVIFLDATGSPEGLEPWLGEDVAWIEGGMPEPGADLKIVQVAGLRLMGFSRGAAQVRRSQAIVDDLLEKHPEAAVIDASNSARLRETDGYWFRDSRGSNAYQHRKILILVGAPIPNVGVLADEYALATGRSPGTETALRTYPIYATNHDNSFYSRTLRESADEGFAQWVRSRTLGELEQAIGRLRGNRRTGEELLIYLLSDYPLDREVELIGAGAIAPKAMEAINAELQNPDTEGLYEYSGVSSNAIEINKSIPNHPQVPSTLSPEAIADIDSILASFVAIGLPPDFDTWLLALPISERNFAFSRLSATPEWRRIKHHRRNEISRGMYHHAMSA